MLLNGPCDRCRSFNGNCIGPVASSHLRSRRVEVKGAAVARAFAAPLLDFRRSKGFDRLLLQRIPRSLLWELWSLLSLRRWIVAIVQLRIVVARRERSPDSATL